MTHVANAKVELVQNDGGWQECLVAGKYRNQPLHEHH